ncbi:hypothetical protein K450DRAFT_242226 [Umbelopsis ramanniana AG]|uniref:Uncharacterized protein n=1 Tax=Umbelopsis ramanniana AG TaxID=1314678 RepID=A0AAD5HCU2_UMBRA|nr:uncharacterized protein K450DRAFT_242226 [Umbelopsis ramanniana AG]KAI8579452.1 hypothetical protein K450DRAFT_242226 [Umbelopsis ramanniana AG]
MSICYVCILYILFIKSASHRLSIVCLDFFLSNIVAFSLIDFLFYSNEMHGISSTHLCSKTCSLQHLKHNRNVSNVRNSLQNERLASTDG